MNSHPHQTQNPIPNSPHSNISSVNSLFAGADARQLAQTLMQHHKKLTTAKSQATLADVETLCKNSEQRLKQWFDHTRIDCPIEETAIATHAIWRLAAVRKTLLIAQGAYPVHHTKKRAPADKSLAALGRMVIELQRSMSQLSRPASPTPASSATHNPSQLPAPTPNSNQPLQQRPSDALPKIQGIRAIGVIRSFSPRHPKPATAPPPEPLSSFDLCPSSLSSSDSSSSEPSAPSADANLPAFNPSACPTLRAPMHTAQQAAKQIETLCQSAGLVPDPAPPTPPQPPPQDPAAVPNSQAQATPRPIPQDPSSAARNSEFVISPEHPPPT